MGVLGGSWGFGEFRGIQGGWGSRGFQGGFQVGFRFYRHPISKEFLKILTNHKNTFEPFLKFSKNFQRLIKIFQNLHKSFKLLKNRFEAFPKFSKIPRDF